VPISEVLQPLPVQYVTTVAEADFSYQTLQIGTAHQLTRPHLRCYRRFQ
jgi:hypothetical protein